MSFKYIKNDGRNLSLIATHLAHIAAGGGRRAAGGGRRAAKRDELFAGVDRPVILASDLNSTANSKAFAALTATRAGAIGNGFSRFWRTVKVADRLRSVQARRTVPSAQRRGD
ncbi:hypothetical protein [Gemmata obscuriglobus]|uniref:hypothetical protein n=1 Tax=Gemmata obscuriglobus TaxID=114 RepID=UPI0011CE3490|nr:hypothetical protein [Gemmata obscuriglobus]